MRRTSLDRRGELKPQARRLKAEEISTCNLCGGRFWMGKGAYGYAAYTVQKDGTTTRTRKHFPGSCDPQAWLDDPLRMEDPSLWGDDGWMAVVPGPSGFSTYCEGCGKSVVAGEEDERRAWAHKSLKFTYFCNVCRHREGILETVNP